MDDLQKWLAAVRKGDKAAFESLYEAMKKPLFTVVLRVTGDRALSEDILQDVFLKLYLSPPEGAVNPRAYLCRMARNLAIDSLRRRRQEAPLEEVENTVFHPTDDLALRMDIEDAILSLPERERQIVTLRLNGELKFREVAEILELPLGTVLWSYQKAIGHLQTVLGGAI